MKKVILFAAAIVALAFASCGGSEEATTGTDSTMTDSAMVADSAMASDSVVADSAVTAEEVVADSTAA